MGRPLYYFVSVVFCIGLLGSTVLATSAETLGGTALPTQVMPKAEGGVEEDSLLLGEMLPLEADPLFAGTSFVKGEQRVPIGSQAELQVPAGFYFFDGASTQVILERMHNLPRGDELGLLCPSDFSWFLLFFYADTGHVFMSGEASHIDAAAILRSFRQDIVLDNQELESRGWESTQVKGWGIAPHYDAEKKSIEWSIVFTDNSDGSDFETYNLRLLGREGVMEVVLVGEEVQESLPAMRVAMQGFSFLPGRAYKDYQVGDREAEGNLYTLITKQSEEVTEDSPESNSMELFLLLMAGGVVLIAIASYYFCWRKGRKQG